MVSGRMNQKTKTELSIDEKVERAWYSRWVALNEDQYQEIIKVLEWHLPITQKTLDALKRGQEYHYTCREDYRKMLEKEAEDKAKKK